MYGWHGPSGWLGLLYFAVLMVLFWGGVVTAIMVIARAARGWRAAWYEHRTSADATRSAEQILAERFARGDIDEETYRRQRDLIRAS
jgi:putative membrane protein